MKPQVKFGLIAGVAGLILNVFVASLMGICSPLVALFAGGAAGFRFAQEGRVASKNDNFLLGAVSGGIAGLLVFVGQLVGGVVGLALVQSWGVTLPFGKVPSPSADTWLQAVYYGGGLGVAACLGGIGIAVAALGGGIAGYLGSPTGKSNSVGSD